MEDLILSRSSPSRRPTEQPMDIAGALLLQKAMTPEPPTESTIDEHPFSADSEESESQTTDALSVKIFEFPTRWIDNDHSFPRQSNRPTPKHEFKGHKRNIWSFVFLHDNVHIVSSSYDGTMRKWDCETGLQVGEPWEGQGGEIHTLALSLDGMTIACGRQDGSVQRWNINGGMIEGIWTGHSDSVVSLSWSPSGGHIASGSWDGTILIRESESGKIEVDPIKTEQDEVQSVAYSPLSDRIASGGTNNTICIWDTSTGKLLVGPTKDLGYGVRSIVWSSDGSKLYSADQFVRVFDSISGTELFRLQHPRPPCCVALSPKHNVLACVGYRSIVQLWNTASNEPLGQPLRPVAEPNHVLFSPDGRYLAYGGDDKKITVWMVKDVVPRIETLSLPCLEVDATQPFAQTDNEENIYDDVFQSPEPSHPSAAYGSSHPLQRPRILSVQRSQNFLVRYQHRQLASDSVPQQERPKCRIFARHTGPRPVTVSAGRPRKLYWHAPRPVRLEKTQNASTQITSREAAADQSQPSAMQLQLTPQMPQHPPPVPTAQPAQEEYDFGCWGNFLHTVCCIRPRPRHTVSAV